MQLFRCERCGALASFEAASCGDCGATLGYLPEELTLSVVTPGPDATYTTVSVDRPMWRCLNSAWGCNWMLPAGTDDVWCRSCRLTRGRPDESDPDAVVAWAAAEAAKRRLIHQLDVLGLPIDGRSWSIPHGLAFDLVHVPGEPGVTGHLHGVVTLDLAEADEQHREDLRRRLDEPFRTLIGHLRHEIGHYYWDRLVGQSDHLAQFRRLFGDDRADYGAALERHHARDRTTWDNSTYVTAYASAHPLEDWAETFAHYLHILDALGTAEAHGLGIAGTEPLLTDDCTIWDRSIGDVLDRWRPVAGAINAVAASIGAPVVYPFEPADAVVRKLEFVHERVRAHAGRGRFYAGQT